VTNFTHLDNKLVFSLNNEFMELMSKIRQCMQQVPEIADIAHRYFWDIRGASEALLRCGIILLLVAGVTACERHKGSKDVSGDGVRILRRGLPGEPRTLDPQLADDDFSFQVVRDLYE
jgi:hypothetical protein